MQSTLLLLRHMIIKEICLLSKFYKVLKVPMKQPLNHLFYLYLYKNEIQERWHERAREMGLHILEILLYKKVCNDFLQVFLRKCGRSKACPLSFEAPFPIQESISFSGWLFIQVLGLFQDLNKIPAVSDYILSFKCCNERDMVKDKWNSMKLGARIGCLSG